MILLDSTIFLFIRTTNMDYKIPWTKYTFKLNLGLAFLNVIIQSNLVSNSNSARCILSCPVLAQFLPSSWNGQSVQEILKLLHRTAQFMNWTLRVSCYCPFHELGIRGAQFMNWAISQIGCNIYIYMYILGLFMFYGMYFSEIKTSHLILSYCLYVTADAYKSKDSTM